MEGAFAWLGDIFNKLFEFLPHWRIVDTTQGAVKFVRGKHPKALGPGWHPYWPLLTTFQVYPTARQSTHLRTQVLMTTDGKTVQVGGMIIYEINDILAILAHTYDPEDTIRDIALSAIHDVISRMAWVDIQTTNERGTLGLLLRKRLRRELKPYGVHVVKVALINLSPVRGVFKLIQSTVQDEEVN